MRVLQGTKQVEAGRETLDTGRPVVVDLGAGDGRWTYETARQDPNTLYVALDPDASALAEYAFRAGRKPSRGGVANALFVVASLEQLPPELLCRAGRVRVNFPWAGLLRGLLRPEPSALAALRSLLMPEGRVELITCYDAAHDSGVLQGEDLPTLDAAYIDSILRPAYAAAGLPIADARRLSRDEALAIPSTWGRRLLHGRVRAVFLIEAG
jgi:16S rRNA (adenine(1408)-N(1))-methyltransferase